MSDELTLPPPSKRDVELTWTRPYILIKNEDSSITVHKEVLSQQVYEVEEGYGFEEIKEEAFRIVVMQPITFGNARLNVLYENSVPTAQDYLSRVGTRTMVGFRCVQNKMLSEQHGKPVYFTYRSFITLP